jgi:dipeptidase E
MPKLILHNDQNDSNLEADRYLFNWLTPDQINLGYVSSSSALNRKYYKDRVRYYGEKIGLKNISYFDFDQEFNSTTISKLSETNVIYLSGGDTQYFGSCLQKTGGMKFLRKFCSQGGIIIGVSAGAIITGPDLGLSLWMDGTPPEQNLATLNLIDFEVFPHYEEHKETNERVLEYAEKVGRKIYLLKKSDSIVIDDALIHSFGSPKIINPHQSEPYDL